MASHLVVSVLARGLLRRLLTRMYFPGEPTHEEDPVLARVPAEDTASLAHLMRMERTPVGSVGDVAMAGDGVPEWRVA